MPIWTKEEKVIFGRYLTKSSNVVNPQAQSLQSISFVRRLLEPSLESLRAVFDRCGKPLPSRGDFKFHGFQQISGDIQNFYAPRADFVGLDDL